MPTCVTADHMQCMSQMRDNIIKQFGLESTSMAVYCMNQSIQLQEQYLKRKKSILKLSADEQVQYWVQNQQSIKELLNEKHLYKVTPESIHRIVGWDKKQDLPIIEATFYTDKRLAKQLFSFSEPHPFGHQALKLLLD